MALRKQLKVREGDYLEAEMVGGSLMLKPVTVLDRETARQQLKEILARPKWRGPGPEPSEELMETVVEELHAMRLDDDQGSSR